MKSAYFNRFEIRMTLEQALGASHPGPCDSEVKELLDTAPIKKQLDKISPDSIRAELQECGAWNETELSDDDENRARLVWLAAGGIREESRG